MPTVGVLYFSAFTPSITLPYPSTSLPIFNSFRYVSLYSLPSLMWYFTILPMVCHFPFLSLLYWIPQCSSTVTIMFYICMFLCVCLSLVLSFMYKRKHVALVFLSLTCFTWHVVLQLHPFTFKPHGVIIKFGNEFSVFKGTELPAPANLHCWPFLSLLTGAIIKPSRLKFLLLKSFHWIVWASILFPWVKLNWYDHKC
jgi:hypothetical protein